MDAVDFVVTVLMSFLVGVMAFAAVIHTRTVYLRSKPKTYHPFPERDTYGYLKEMDWQTVAKLEHEHGYDHLPESQAVCREIDCLQTWLDEMALDEAIPELQRLTHAGIITVNDMRQLTGFAVEAVKKDMVNPQGQSIFSEPKASEYELAQIAFDYNARGMAWSGEKTKPKKKPWQAVRPGGRRLNMDGSVDLIAQKDFMGFNMPDERIHEAGPIRAGLALRAAKAAFGTEYSANDSVVMAEDEFENFELPETYRGVWALMRTAAETLGVEANAQPEWYAQKVKDRLNEHMTFDATPDITPQDAQQFGYMNEHGEQRSASRTTHSVTFDRTPEITPLHKQGNPLPHAYTIKNHYGYQFQIDATNVTIHQLKNGSVRIDWVEPQQGVGCTSGQSPTDVGSSSNSRRDGSAGAILKQNTEGPNPDLDILDPSYARAWLNQ